ncbi:hypothetical protein JTE90_005265 [Oedothorax gibbosus]|uniref:Uncharacterized protein n=1 Tax=Oedothorax gibbosus TaxID=931172 RepID=A0AAV6U1M0_9ARAC|nr:hypothetical protein JTE90_005265 [Oedothorax gibbosus]
MLEGIDGILMTQIKQPLGRIQACVNLLKAINAPFAQQATVQHHIPEMDTFLEDYTAVVQQIMDKSEYEESEKKILKNLQNTLCAMISTKDKRTNNQFELYFNVLVPLVQACHNKETLLPADTDQEARASTRESVETIPSHSSNFWQV